jgi:hypothetical protein
MVTITGYGLNSSPWIVYVVYGLWSMSQCSANIPARLSTDCKYKMLDQMLTVKGTLEMSLSHITCLARMHG